MSENIAETREVETQENLRRNTVLRKPGNEKCTEADREEK